MKTIVRMNKDTIKNSCDWKLKINNIKDTLKLSGTFTQAVKKAVALAKDLGAESIVLSIV